MLRTVWVVITSLVICALGYTGGWNARGRKLMPPAVFLGAGVAIVDCNGVKTAIRNPPGDCTAGVDGVTTINQEGGGIVAQGKSVVNVSCVDNLPCVTTVTHAK